MYINIDMADNVILFPFKVFPSRKNPSSKKDVKENLELLRVVQVNEIVEMFVEEILKRLEILGYNISANKNLKDGAFMLEALKSLLLKQHDIYHPFQQLAETVYEVDKQPDDEYNLRLVDNINISLQR